MERQRPARGGNSQGERQSKEAGMIVKETLTNRHSKTYLCGIHVIFDLERRRKQQMQGKLSVPAPTPRLKSLFNSSPTGEEFKDFF